MVFTHYHLFDITSTHSLKEDFLEATIIVTLGTLPGNVKLLKNVKLIHLFSAGADRLPETPVWKETNIPLTNSSGVHGPQIAEWVAMQILTQNHKQKLLLEFQKKHHWATHDEIGWLKDWVGQRLGVLGYGAIGRQGRLIFPLACPYNLLRTLEVVRQWG
jgi:phosphoglycerate dehydrogenase-like enzyme